MKTIDKNNVTILMPCYNEQELVKNSIAFFKKCGFKKILVVESSRSKTYKPIKNENVDVIFLKSPLVTFDLAVLYGIYNADTEYILIVDPDTTYQADQLEEFVSFGVKGNFPLLFPRQSNKRTQSFIKILKERLGIFIGTPGFQIVFLNKSMRTLIMNEVSGSGTFIYFEFIKAAINQKYKIGVFPIYTNEHLPTNFVDRQLMRRRLNMEKYSHTKFAKYAFPDLFTQQIRHDLLLGIIGSVVTLIITNFLPKLFDYLNKINLVP